MKEHFETLEEFCNRWYTNLMILAFAFLIPSLFVGVVAAGADEIKLLYAALIFWAIGFGFLIFAWDMIYFYRRTKNREGWIDVRLKVLGADDVDMVAYNELVAVLEKMKDKIRIPDQVSVARDGSINLIWGKYDFSLHLSKTFTIAPPYMGWMVGDTVDVFANMKKDYPEIWKEVKR